MINQLPRFEYPRNGTALNVVQTEENRLNFHKANIAHKLKNIKKITLLLLVIKFEDLPKAQLTTATPSRKRHGRTIMFSFFQPFGKTCFLKAIWSFGLHTKCKGKWSKSPISPRNDLQKILLTNSLINIRYPNQQGKNARSYHNCFVLSAVEQTCSSWKDKKMMKLNELEKLKEIMLHCTKNRLK